MSSKNYLLVILSNLVERLFQYLLIILLIGSSFMPAHAVDVNNLLKLLSSTNSDAKRIDLMNELSSQLKDIDLEQSLAYAQQALDKNRNVIADFVCPTEQTRADFNADYIVWMDTIKEGRFETYLN